jgi:S-adenosylmethionine decarboxylase
MNVLQINGWDNQEGGHMKGLEIRVDLFGVSPQKLEKGEALARVCEEAAIVAGATVKGMAYADLGNGDGTQPGCTVAILLNESHITVHTYSEEGLAAVNVFTCERNAYARRAMEFITTALGGKVAFKDEVERFNLGARA